MSAAQSDTQLIQLVKRLLDSDPVDVARLREIAAKHGLVSSRLRARAWPKLLAADVYDPATSATAFEALQRDVSHADAGIVAGDVDRCAWLPREGLSGAQLAARRQQLATLIDGAICHCNADPSFPRVAYFQGLHDLAAVLLITQGERAGAHACLVALLRRQLRDATGTGLEPILAQLELLPLLIARADPELAAFLAKASRGFSRPGGDDDDDDDAPENGRDAAPARAVPKGAPAPAPRQAVLPSALAARAARDAHFSTHFAVSWALTWFAHSVPSLPAIQRIFDALLASHPLMYLYFGAAAMMASRSIVLAGPCDYAEVHRLLSALPALSRPVGEGGVAVPILLKAARALAARLPPQALAGLPGAPPLPASCAAAAWPFDDLGPPPRPDRILKHLPRPPHAAVAARAAARPGSFLASGWGARVAPCGGSYAGAVAAGWRSGLGRFVDASRREAYEGAWEGDTRHGLGVVAWADGAHYAGEWRDGRLHGAGVFTWPSGRSFAGTFRNDRRHGRGVVAGAGGSGGDAARFEEGKEIERAPLAMQQQQQPGGKPVSSLVAGAAAAAQKAHEAAAGAHGAAATLRRELRARGLDKSAPGPPIPPAPPPPPPPRRA